MLLLLLALGCRNVETPFPEGMEPLEENRATCPEGSGAHSFPEEIELVSGRGDEFDWTHACAYVLASAADTWEALKDPDVVVDRREVAEWSALYDVEEGYDYTMLVHHLVHDLITVEYDITWRHAVVVEGTDAPEILAVRWQKTFGASVIDILEGSMVVRSVEDDVTKLEIAQHLKAATRGPDTMESFQTDLHTDIVAFVNGDELPTYP
ncbi:MAG: hypothetical protein JRJ84_17360 [Deltaproteobacteria bacterium]|nr:hypothetical protein [Deltaproteobacteria bacterium]